MSIKEDMGSAVPANSVGGGGVAAIGVPGPNDKTGEPPGIPASRRRKLKSFRDVVLTQNPLKRRMPQ